VIRGDALGVHGFDRPAFFGAWLTGIGTAYVAVAFLDAHLEVPSVNKGVRYAWTGDLDVNGIIHCNAKGFDRFLGGEDDLRLRSLIDVGEGDDLLGEGVDQRPRAGAVDGAYAASPLRVGMDAQGAAGEVKDGILSRLWHGWCSRHGDRWRVRTRVSDRQGRGGACGMIVCIDGSFGRCARRLRYAPPPRHREAICTISLRRILSCAAGAAAYAAFRHRFQSIPVGGTVSAEYLLQVVMELPSPMVSKLGT